MKHKCRILTTEEVETNRSSAYEYLNLNTINNLKTNSMNIKNEIKKALYKEKPKAKQTAVYRDGGKDYEAETSIVGKVKFHVPFEEQGETPFDEIMEAHLLIRWIKKDY